MVPEETDEVVQYLVVDEEYANKYIEVENFDSDEFFNELDNGRHPGHVLASWEDVSLEEAEKNSPYTIS